MATIQPTPLPTNSITDGEGTPPTTNQQTQEPVDSLTTSDRPATDPEGTVTEHELRVPTTSEAATDLPIMRTSDIGLIVRIVIIVIVVIAAVVSVVVIIAVLFKRRGKMVLDKKRALSNPVYSSKGQSTSALLTNTVPCLLSLPCDH